jgi:trafficking protein particle complex subunit 11
MLTFNTHNRRMSSLYNGWGLGIETADYWHWLSRNNRIFADLLDISEAIIVGANEIDEGTKLITGDSILNSDMILQHPGYYYLLAANCIRQKHAKAIELAVYQI